MCRFKLVLICFLLGVLCVSIHPMCRFKDIYICAKSGKIECFNTSYVSVQAVANMLLEKLPNRFQYILCVGSRDRLVLTNIKMKLFQYILCVGSRRVVKKMSGFNFKFQYILCVGSREISALTLPHLIVSIHPMCRFKLKNKVITQ